MGKCNTERSEAMRNNISTESIFLSTICIVDMVSTLYLVAIGSAVEANPIMAACLRCSPAMFILAKLMSFVPFVVITEWYRRRNPSFALNASRAAIGVYLFTYVVLITKINFV